MLLILTTIRRLALLLLVFLVSTPAAYAWSWPVQGPVVQPFSYDEAHPYVAGQHRGVDIGADAAGETVVAPATGTVSFAGSVPTNGKTITIETTDGYSVTLTHLGSIAVAKGTTVAEQDAVATIGPSGTTEVDEPYVHLGIRISADPNGYVDPLGLLPPGSASTAEDAGSTTSQPATTGASSAPPATKPAASEPRGPRVTHVRGSTAKPGRRDLPTQEHGRVPATRTDAQPSRSYQRPAAQETDAPLDAASPRPRVSQRTRSSERPVVEPATPEPIGLDSGHEIRVNQPAVRSRSRPSGAVLGLVCNGAAAVFALGAALAAGRRRRVQTRAAAAAQVLHLARPRAEHRLFSRAA